MTIQYDNLSIKIMWDFESCGLNINIRDRVCRNIAEALGNANMDRSISLHVFCQTDTMPPDLEGHLNDDAGRNVRIHS